MGETEASGGLPSSESKIEIWDSTTRFKDYLYRIAILGNQGAESIQRFPNEIKLDDDWHSTINLMRELSRDRTERSTIAGFQKDARCIFLSKKFEKGTNWKAHFLNGLELQERYGILHPAVPIHSHPGGWFDRFVSKAAVATRMAKGLEGFSPEDFYAMFMNTSLPVQAVVEKNHTYFAFRTSETNTFLSDNPLPSKEEFVKHWYRRIGVYQLASGKFALAFSVSVDLEKMNLGIAEVYSLAFYRGKRNENLKKIYPG